MTAAFARRIATEKGISTTMVSIAKRRGDLYINMIELPPEVIKRNLESGERRNNTETDRLIRKYNRQSKKIAAALRAAGVEIGGTLRGSGVWDYSTRRWTASGELARNNID